MTARSLKKNIYHPTQGIWTQQSALIQKLFLKLHKTATADKGYRLILLPSPSATTKPQERK